MKLFLKRSSRSQTLFLTGQIGDEKPRALGIVFQRDTGDGFGWKAGRLADEGPFPDETTALENLYAELGFTF